MLTLHNAWFEPLEVEFPDFGLEDESLLKPSSCDEFIKSMRLQSLFSHYHKENLAHFGIANPQDVMEKLSGQFKGNPADEQVLRDSLKILTQAQQDCQHLVQMNAPVSEQHHADAEALTKIIQIVSDFAASHNIVLEA